VAGLFGLQKSNFVLTTIVQPVINMAILDNLEASMADDDGMPSQKDIETIKEILKDPHLEERLKYMEEHGI
jgi:hypothetical protein